MSQGDEPESDVLIIRPSSTSKWTDCPRRSAARSFSGLVQAAGYILRQTPDHIGAVIGTAVHKGAERLLRGKMVTGELPAMNEGVDAALEQFSQDLDTKEVGWDKETQHMSVGVKQVTRMVGQYRKDVADHVNPVAVEERLEGRLTPGIVVSGMMDCVVVAPNEIMDTKTGKNKSWNLPQYGCYSALARAHGHSVERVVEHYIPRMRIDREQSPVEKITIDAGEAEQIAIQTIKMISEDVAKFKETGDRWAFRSNPSSYLCSDRFCPAWGTNFCKEWRKK